MGNCVPEPSLTAADGERMGALSAALPENRKRNERIISLRVGGVGPREIARRLNLSPQLVAGVLFRAGLTKPTSGRGNGPTEDVKLAAVRLAKEMGQRRAAKVFGVSTTTIFAWIRSAA